METCANPVFSIEERADSGARERWRRSEFGSDDTNNLASDLVSGVDLPMLRLWVEAEVERFRPLIAGKPFAGPKAVARFRNTLKLLCFGYALGVTRSVEIVEASAREPEFRLVAAGLRPFADELKSFRRRYRAVIEVVLARTLLRATVWQAEFQRTFSPILEEQCENTARALLNIARHLDSCDDC
jgi:hypothetical protein